MTYECAVQEHAFVNSSFGMGPDEIRFVHLRAQTRPKTICKHGLGVLFWFPVGSGGIGGHGTSCVCNGHWEGTSVSHRTVNHQGASVQDRLTLPPNPSDDAEIGQTEEATCSVMENSKTQREKWTVCHCPRTRGASTCPFA